MNANGRTEVTCWKRVLGGLLSACLLIPVPVLAIDFHNVAWDLGLNNQGVVTNAPFFTFGSGISQSNTTGSSVLIFTFPGQGTTGKTVVQTKSGQGIAVGPGETLKASWSGLNALNSPFQGSDPGASLKLTPMGRAPTLSGVARPYNVNNRAKRD